jgi:hypothetical protein
MSFLFKNKSLRMNEQKADPLPGFFKTEPSFNMDPPIFDQKEGFRDDFHSEAPSFSSTPPQFQLERDRQQQGPVSSSQGPVMITLSHSGVLGILFALLLLGVLFFMAGFLSGMMISDYASQASISVDTSKKSAQNLAELGDDNV